MLLLEKLHLSHSYNLFCKTQKYEIISYYIGIGHDKQVIIVYWHIIILLFFGHRNLLFNIYIELVAEVTVVTG